MDELRQSADWALYRTGKLCALYVMTGWRTIKKKSSCEGRAPAAVASSGWGTLWLLGKLLANITSITCRKHASLQAWCGLQEQLPAVHQNRREDKVRGAHLCDAA